MGYPKYIVFHVENTGDPENGPGGLAQFMDERFATRSEAVAWIAGRPGYYIHEQSEAEIEEEQQIEAYFNRYCGGNA